MRSLLIAIGVLSIFVACGRDTESRPSDLTEEKREPSSLERTDRNKMKLLAVASNGLKFRNDCVSKGLKATLENEPSFKMNFSAYAPWIWQGFFSGSVTLPLLIESQNPVSAYFNPYVDGVIFVEWDSADSGAAIKRISGSSAAALLEARNPSLNDLPRYVANSERIEDGHELRFPLHLIDDSASLIRRLESRFPPLGGESFSFEGIGDPMAGMDYIARWTFAGAGEVLRLQDSEFSKDSRKAIQGLRRSFVSTEDYRSAVPDNVGLGVQQLLEIPGEIRKEMVPVFAINAGARIFVFYTNVHFSPVFISAEFLPGSNYAVDQVLLAPIGDL